MIRSGLILVALLMIAAIQVGGPARVEAHARLKESTPAKGEVLAVSPSSITITFSNDIQKIEGTYGIDVQGPAGADVAASAATLDEVNRSLLSVSLQPDLPQGRYVVSYTNVSDADGDPFEGGFAFYVGVQPTSEQLAADALLEPPEVAATPTFKATTAVGDETPEPKVIGEPGEDANDDDGDPNVALIVAGAIIVLAVVAAGVWFAMRGSRASS